MHIVARWLFRLVFAGLVAALAAVGYGLREHPTRARQLAFAVIEPAVAWWYGDGFVPDFGPAFPADAEPRADRDALERALATAFPEEPVAVLAFDNPILWRSQHPFAYQDLADPALDRLHEALKLDEVLGDTDDLDRELDTLRRLSAHVRAIGTNGFGNYYKLAGEDAFNVLDYAGRDDNKLWCHTYSLLFVQAALAAGYHARLVSASYWEYRDHATVEVWSNQYRRWILFDVQYDLIYMRDGVPQDAYAVHAAMRDIDLAYRRWLMDEGLEDWRFLEAEHGGNPIGEGNVMRFLAEHPEVVPSDLEIQRGYHQESWIDERLTFSPTHKNIEIYHAYAIAMRNDYLTERYPKGHPRRRLELSPVAPSDDWLARYDSVFTSRLPDLYWSLNQVRAAFASGDEREDHRGIDVQLGTFTPSFRNFEIRVDGAVAATQREPMFRWKLEPGEHTLSARAVNVRGVKGPPMTVHIRIGASTSPKPAVGPAD